MIPKFIQLAVSDHHEACERKESEWWNDVIICALRRNRLLLISIHFRKGFFRLKHH